jgi:hypothetical protein
MKAEFSFKVGAGGLNREGATRVSLSAGNVELVNTRMVLRR